MASEGFTDVMVRSVPKQLLKDFDEAIEGEYPSRAEAIRYLMRQFLREKEAKADA